MSKLKQGSMVLQIPDWTQFRLFLIESGFLIVSEIRTDFWTGPNFDQLWSGFLYDFRNPDRIPYRTNFRLF